MGATLDNPMKGGIGCAYIGMLLPDHSAGNYDFWVGDLDGDPLYWE